MIRTGDSLVDSLLDRIDFSSLLFCNTWTHTNSNFSEPNPFFSQFFSSLHYSVPYIHSSQQVFCCIAIVGVAIIYFVVLWVRQLFSWPRRDKSVSDLPAPPRACTGNGALPVYGHTRLFFRLAGDVALLFQPEWREWNFLPDFMSRPLGECFAIFIWGKWRVVVKGPERTKLVMDAVELKEGWPWTPPVTLLGKSCFAFLQEEESEQMRQLIERPLGHRCVVQYAPLFAELAEKCLDEVIRGVFTKKSMKKPASTATAWGMDATAVLRMDDGYHTDFDDDTNGSTGGEHVAKIKWEALRSYTFDLIDGPILNMNKWVKRTEQCQGQATREGDEQEPESGDKEENNLEPREKMILWMDRMKSGLCVIKITFGPRWMHIWRCNEYGRALNARTHLEKIIQRHVAKLADRVPVKHARGHTYQDPTTRAIPLLGLRDNIMRSMEGILGGPELKPNLAPRSRTKSLNMVQDGCPDENDCEFSEYVKAFHIEQDLARPKYEMSPPLAAARKGLNPLVQAPESPSRKAFRDEIENRKSPLQPTVPVPPIEQDLARPKCEMSPTLASARKCLNPLVQAPESPSRKSFRDEIENLKSPLQSRVQVPPIEEKDLARPKYETSPTLVAARKCLNPLVQAPESPCRKSFQDEIANLKSSLRSIVPAPVAKKENIEVISVLERLLRQQDLDGNGLSQVVTTDISILLWMMMDAGNAWTAMALNLLSTDTEARGLVQEEIDSLEMEHGQANLFTPWVLDKMQYLDALLYEAIRLCPAFLGGMKTTNVTVELPGIQIPKNSDVIFCQPTDMKFNVHLARGRKPEDLGRRYPCLEL
jgi:cytochrome P450